MAFIFLEAHLIIMNWIGVVDNELMSSYLPCFLTWPTYHDLPGRERTHSCAPVTSPKSCENFTADDIIKIHSCWDCVNPLSESDSRMCVNGRKSSACLKLNTPPSVCLFLLRSIHITICLCINILDLVTCLSKTRCHNLSYLSVFASRGGLPWAIAIFCLVRGT